jgi:DnaJ homolog subfamily C member 19
VKYLWILVLAAIACRLIAGRWPWQLLAGATRASDEERARALLGVGPDASRGEIVEAHRRLIARVHPDRGGSSEQAHEANAARDLLLRRLPGPDQP